MTVRFDLIANEDFTPKVGDEQAEEAFRTLLLWLGEDPAREGLMDTPARTLRSWKEYFSGYREDPRDHLKTTFEETESFSGIISLENIRVESFCEHHLAPFVGEATVAYVPNGRVTGISKLARVVEGYAKRLQIQERLTSQIAQAVQDVLAPKGVAVALRAEHSCIGMRGIHKPGATMLTVTTLGCFDDDASYKEAFMASLKRA